MHNARLCCRAWAAAALLAVEDAYINNEDLFANAHRLPSLRNLLAYSVQPTSPALVSFLQQVGLTALSMPA